MKTPEIKPHIKALIFDMDGTLLNTISIHYQAWETVCAKYGITVTKDYFFHLTGRPILEIGRQIVQDFQATVSPEVLVAEKEALVKANNQPVELIEPIVQLVYNYTGVLPMAIGTGSDREKALHMLTKTGLLHYFDCVVSADDVQNHKPHPETFLRCAEQMGIAPEFCQVFEDGQAGLTAAQSAGMLATDVKPYYNKPVWN